MSGSMEVAGVRNMWARSVHDLKLEYTTYFGDGDSRAFEVRQAMKPYCPHVMLVKHECVGHVSKRLGTTLRNLKKRVRMTNMVGQEA